MTLGPWGSGRSHGAAKSAAGLGSAKSSSWEKRSLGCQILCSVGLYKLHSTGESQGKEHGK